MHTCPSLTYLYTNWRVKLNKRIKQCVVFFSTVFNDKFCVTFTENVRNVRNVVKLAKFYFFSNAYFSVFHNAKKKV